MSDIKISLVASSIRADLWKPFADSLIRTKIPYEIIFVGRNEGCIPVPSTVKFIKSNVKPAQCYEIGFRHAKGELIHWTADDAEYSLNSLDDIYILYEGQNNYKAMMAFTTIEDSRDCTDWHHLVGGVHTSPVMAPFGTISRKFLDEIGGYDRRFVCGQSENSLVMDALERGGSVIQTPYKVFVEHTKKHQGSRGSLFRGKYYQHDRKILEQVWIKDGKVSSKRLVPFEPFVKTPDWLEVSQGPKGENAPWN